MAFSYLYKIKQPLVKNKIFTGAVFLLVICSASVYSQEIKFRKNTSWDSTLAVAKASGKLIFVDVYTAWCGPCKLMDQEVFTDNKVSTPFNNDFICYKLDAEKGRGPELSKKYNVFSYPTYLFINGGGTLIYRANGSMPAQNFLQEAANALNEAKEPVTLLQLDSQYVAKKQDTVFMYTYLQRRLKLKQDNADLLDEYCRLLTESQQSSLKTLQLIADNGAFSVRNLQIGIALTLLLKNQQQFPLLKNTESVDTYISLAEQRTLTKAISLKDENLLHTVLELNKTRKLPPYDDEYDDMLKLKYLNATGQHKKYISTASILVDKKLITIPDTTLEKGDKTALDDVTKSMQVNLANKTDQEKQQALSSYRHLQTIQLIRVVNSTCRDILSFSKQKQDINNGLRRMKRCIYLAERDTGYYKYIYPVCLNTYASYLYRSGAKQKAITYQAKALKLMSVKNIADSDEEIAGYKKSLDQMKNNRF
ncbi:MAG TPA: thioredoxin family protein [Mucilaginibacter sp.]|nr:thioredoxin family protein [Mucilaginibacter sp.]